MQLNFEDGWENKNQDEEVVKIDITKLRANPYQPRKHFDIEVLNELADSIKEFGVFQPIIVRKSQIKGYDIVAGERRYRASKLAGKTEIPAIIRTMSDSDMMYIAVIENLQRKDLSPFEEALSYQTLIDNLKLTQQELAEKLGKSRSYIANQIRLLNLPKQVREYIETGKLTVGQVRPLVTIESDKEKIKIAKMIVNNEWKSRDVESYVSKKKKQKKKNKKTKTNILYQEIERQLSDKFGTIVNVIGEKEGRVEFQFLSPDDLTHLLDQWNIKID